MTVCLRCSEENTDRAKFCSACGTPLGGAGTERRERRVVTALFADLAGFTRRSESLDVEDVEGFLDPYFAVLREEVERTGGLIAKFTGDGVMALFGASTAHEDDPERAVRCGLAICERVGKLAGDLHVRVGITTGEAMVTLAADGHADAIGDVINTAARLEAAAPHDGVLVDAWTFHATSREIDYGEHDAVAAKGKTEPVSVWVAQAPRSIVPERQRDRLPLVGRNAEAQELRDAFERSRSQPTAQLVSIIGVPGIGKTRLVEHLHDHVDALPDLVTWRRGRSLPYGEGAPMWALGEIVRAQAGILDSESDTAVRDKLRAAVGRLIVDEHDREWMIRELGRLVGLEAAADPGEGDRAQAFAAWQRFVEALAEEAPAVLVFEDIHWADDTLLDFLETLATHPGPVPLLVVCTARSELHERRPHWPAAETKALTINPRPLTADEVVGMMGALLGRWGLPPEVEHTVLEHAAGNPLYVEEYVRMLRDRGILVESSGGGGWELTGEVLGLPETIHGVIAARLDMLSPDEKSVIQDAAVVGKTAWLGAVHALHERPREQVEALIASLEQKQLVQTHRRSSVAGEVEFTFAHALTRDVAYGQIRRADRARKHLAAADWIEARPHRRTDQADMLADHYARALTLLEQTGDDVAPIRPRARDAYIRAGNQAAASYAHTTAGDDYRAALELTPPDDTSTRATLLLRETTARYDSDTCDRPLLDAALAAQIEAEHWEGAAWIERMYAKWCDHHARSAAEAETHRLRGAEFAARIPPSNIMCHIASDQAFAMVISGRAPEAITVTAEILPLAQGVALEAGCGHLLMAQGVAKAALGDATAVDDLRVAADMLVSHWDIRTADVFGNLADMLRGLGDMAGADAAYSTAGEWSRRLAQPDGIDWISQEQALQAYHAAEWGTAERLIGEVLQPDNDSTIAQMQIVRGRLSIARGLIPTAFDDAVRIEEFAAMVANDDYLYCALPLLARCHVAVGEDDEALATCERFLTRWHATGGLANRAIELCEITNTTAMYHRHTWIHDAGLLLPEASRWRHAVLLVADRKYAEAAAAYGQVGSEPLAADAHLLAAHHASEQGRPADAASHAKAALRFAAQTGAVIYQRQAETLIAANA